MAGKRRRGASAEPEQEDDDDDEEEEEAEEAENFDEEAARKAAKRMKVAELRAALEELGETPDGSKPELVEQLVAAQCAAAAEGGGEEDDGNDSGEEEEDEPNVCDMEDRALLEEAVKQVGPRDQEEAAAERCRPARHHLRGAIYLRALQRGREGHAVLLQGSSMFWLSDIGTTSRKPCKAYMQCSRQ